MVVMYLLLFCWSFILLVLILPPSIFSILSFILGLLVFICVMGSYMGLWLSLFTGLVIISGVLLLFILFSSFYENKFINPLFLFLPLFSLSFFVELFFSSSSLSGVIVFSNALVLSFVLVCLTIVLLMMWMKFSETKMLRDV